MIKLISSDMDGTLLDTDSNVPPETFDLIRGLAEKGVRFVAGSGRRLDTLMEFFEPVLGIMDFVASNGTQVQADGRLIDREVYSHASLMRLEKLVSQFDMLHLVLYDEVTSFLLDDESVYEREIDKDLPRAERIFATPGPEISIIKASVYCDDEREVMDMAYVMNRELGSELSFAPSGRKWIDVMQPHVSKATGIQQVMEHYGIRRDEVMAFGDSMNDYEILSYVGDSYAMGNGRYAIKRVAKHVIGTNAEHAVQKEMKRLLAAHK
jgi:hypothetical protein